jgi:hypothetical protein
MMVPDLRVRNCGRTAWIIAMVPKVLVSKMRRIMSSRACPHEAATVATPPQCRPQPSGARKRLVRFRPTAVISASREQCRKLPFIGTNSHSSAPSFALGAERRCKSCYSRYGVSTSSIHFMNARVRRDRLLRCATTRDTAIARRRKAGMISTSAPLSRYCPIPKSGA